MSWLQLVLAAGAVALDTIAALAFIGARSDPRVMADASPLTLIVAFIGVAFLTSTPLLICLIDEKIQRARGETTR